MKQAFFFELNFVFRTESLFLFFTPNCQFMKKLSLVHFSAIGLIILSILMSYVYFLNTGNFNSPVIEFEFVKNSKDVKDIFMQDNELKYNEIKGVNDQNIVDFAYMLFYSSLLVFTLLKIKKTDNKIFFNLAIVFSVIAFLSDIFENIELFKITKYILNGNDFSEPVKMLFVITRLKWLSIAFVMFLLSFHYYKNGIIGKIFALISALPLLTVFAFIVSKDAGNDFVKIFTSFIILGFVILMIWIFISKKINANVNFYKNT